jgi:hypothetical protein
MLSSQVTAGADAPFDPDRISAPPLRRLHDYWRAKAGTRPLPARADLDPVEIPWALGHLSLIDVLPDGDFRFRLDAPRNAEFFKLDMTGKTLADYPYPDRAVFMRRSYAAAARGVPQLAQRDFTLEFRRWRYEILLLPLAPAGGRVDILMSMLHIGDEMRV